MRWFVRGIDILLRRSGRIFEFTDDPLCILRLQIAPAPHALRLASEVIPAGELVLHVHVWNEHMPPLPASGADVAWGVRMQRMMVRSFRAAAQVVRDEPRLEGLRAIGGAMSFVSPGDHPGGAHLMERLGFTLEPYHSRLGRFGEFWENLFASWIMWTFNPPSLRRRTPFQLQRMEIWMSMEEFLDRYARRSPAA